LKQADLTLYREIPKPEGKVELIYRCQKCGGTVHIQGDSREEIEKWIENASGYCPAGGNHVELSFKGYLEYVGESESFHEITSREVLLKEKIKKLLEEVKKGNAVLTAGNIGIPTIHHVKDARHCGFGFFEAPLPNGNTVNFDAGGAMNRAPEPIYGWTYLRGDAEGWGYPYKQVIERLTEILEDGYTPKKWEAE